VGFQIEIMTTKQISIHSIGKAFHGASSQSENEDIDTMMGKIPLSKKIAFALR